MESTVRQMRELIYATPVVVFLVVMFTKAIFLRVLVCKDAAATSMEPEARILLGMTFDQSSRDGFGRTFVV